MYYMYNSVVFIDSCDMKSKINFKENIFNIIYSLYTIQCRSTIQYLVSNSQKNPKVVIYIIIYNTL